MLRGEEVLHAEGELLHEVGGLLDEEGEVPQEEGRRWTRKASPTSDCLIVIFSRCHQPLQRDTKVGRSAGWRGAEQRVRAARRLRLRLPPEMTIDDLLEE